MGYRHIENLYRSQTILMLRECAVDEAAALIKISERWIRSTAKRRSGITIRHGWPHVLRADLDFFMERDTRLCHVGRALKQQHDDCADILSAVQCTERAMRWCKGKQDLWISGELTGFVYFARKSSEGTIKIGFSTHPVRRLFQHFKNEGVIAVFLVIPGSEELEHQIHAMCSEYRVRPEWFRPSHKLHRFIRWLAEGLPQ